MSISGNVTVVTPWRQREDEVLRYEERFEALDYPAHRLRFVMVEGDSTDGTRARLESWAGLDDRLTVLRCDLGKPYYPSVVNPERFWVLGTVFNAGLDAVNYGWADYVLFMPCDVEFPPDLLRRLLDHHAPIVAPFVFQRGVFYDIWAFSRRGANFPPFPEDSTEALFGSDLVELETLGGVALIDADVLRAGVRYSTINVDRGLCEAARAKGFSVWADPTLHVYHGVIR